MCAFGLGDHCDVRWHMLWKACKAEGPGLPSGCRRAHHVRCAWPETPDSAAAMPPTVTLVDIQCRNVRSLAKNALASVFGKLLIVEPLGYSGRRAAGNAHSADVSRAEGIPCLHPTP